MLKCRRRPCHRELDGGRDRESRLLEASAREQFEQEDVSRLLIHSNKVRSKLERFLGAVIARHVARIESFALDGFRQLVRKRIRSVEDA